MALKDLSKRDLIRLGAGLSVAFVATRGFAQKTKMFGIEIPKEVLDILPAKPLNLVRAVETVLQLERDADRKGLPQSILALNKGKPIIASETSLYEAALPRLVAIIDRSELQDIGLADQAGSLLAELHATQHEVPEALRLMVLANNRASSSNLVLGMEPQAGTANTTLPDILNLPDTLPQDAGVTLPIPDLPKVEPIPQPGAPLIRARDFASLRQEYRRLFMTAEIRPAHQETAGWFRTMITKSRSRYEGVSKTTGVPWYFIAVTHALESSCNFRAHLHNGDFPLSARTRQVPSNRPTIWLPPSDWESSARDALRLLGFTGQKDWSLERTLYRLEAYNGLGYRSYGIASPYLWSFSNHYDRGKFVSDGKWSSTARSQQCGAAVMLKLLHDAGEINLLDSEPA
jgi:lysozyme family protein